MDINSYTIIEVFKRKSSKPIPLLKMIWKDISGKVSTLTQYAKKGQETAKRCSKHGN